MNIIVFQKYNATSRVFTFIYAEVVTLNLGHVRNKKDLIINVCYSMQELETSFKKKLPLVLNQ